MSSDEMRMREFGFSPKIFGERLRQRMKEISITQKELGARSGCGQSNISRYLKGEQAPNLAQAVALASVLECDLGWLAGADGKQAATPEPPNGEYVGPVSALEKAALTKTLTVLRSTELRGSPAQALAVTIDAHYESVQYAAELGRNGGTRQQRVGESPENSVRRRKAR